MAVSLLLSRWEGNKEYLGHLELRMALFSQFLGHFGLFRWGELPGALGLLRPPKKKPRMAKNGPLKKAILSIRAPILHERGPQGAWVPYLGGPRGPIPRQEIRPRRLKRGHLKGHIRTFKGPFRGPYKAL